MIGRALQVDACVRFAGKRFLQRLDRARFPIPASPITVTIWPSPCCARCQRSSINPISCARPISGKLPPARMAAKRLSTDASPRTRQAGTGRANPFNSWLSDVVELEQAAQQILGRFAHENGCLAPASACRRAARLGVSPTIVRSCAVPLPMISPTTTKPVAIPIRACTRVAVRQLDAAYLRRCGDRGTNGAFRGILEGERKAEISQDAIAHELGDEAAVTPDRAGSGILVPTDQTAEEFGVHFAR